MLKVLASLLLSVCLYLPGWDASAASSVDKSPIERRIYNAVRDVQIQIPELLKAVRVRVQVPEIRVQIPEINVHIPEILIPPIHIQAPIHVEVPAVRRPEIRIQMPKIDIRTRELR